MAAAFAGPVVTIHAKPPTATAEDGMSSRGRLARRLAAAQAAGLASSWKEGLQRGAEALDGGKAKAALEKLAEVSHVPV